MSESDLENSSVAVHLLISSFFSFFFLSFFSFAATPRVQTDSVAQLEGCIHDRLTDSTFPLFDFIFIMIRTGD